MNVKPVEISNYLPWIIRFFGIAIWGAIAFLLLSAPIASAEEHPHGNHDSLVLMKPSDLPAGAQVPGEDMYLYEGNARTYLYVEQDLGKRLLILDVTDPNKIWEVGEKQISTDVPYDFAGSVDGALGAGAFPYQEGRVVRMGSSATQATSIANTRDVEPE